MSLVSAQARPDADLVIGASSGTLRGFLPAALGRLHATNAGLRSQVVTGSDQQLLARLRNRQIDLLVSREPVCRDQQSLRFEALRAEPVPMVARHHHQLAAMSHLTARALADFPIIVPHFDQVLAAGIERHLVTEGCIDTLDPIVADSLEFAVALVQKSDCLLAIPQGAIEDELRRRVVVSLPIDRPLPDVQVGVISTADQPVSALAMQVIALCRDAVSTAGHSHRSL